MLNFHERRAGASAFVFGDAADESGTSSYERLVQRLPASRVRILDLACGDGMLLSLIGSNHDAIGLDLSYHELRAGRARTSRPLVLSRAQRLPFTTAQFEYLVCHMALMLLDDLDEVVAELTRVLVPRGRLLAVVGRRGDMGDSARRLSVLSTQWRRDTTLTIGDVRSGSPEGLAEVFSGTSWCDLEVEDFSVRLRVPSDEIFRWLENAFYHIDLMPQDAKLRLSEFVEKNQRELAENGFMPWTLNMRLVSVTRAS